VPAETFRLVAQDLEIRAKWDTSFKDMKLFYKSEDGSKARMTMTYISPASLIAYDR